jgi:hypothetical protein
MNNLSNLMRKSSIAELVELGYAEKIESSKLVEPIRLYQTALSHYKILSDSAMSVKHIGRIYTTHTFIDDGTMTSPVAIGLALVVKHAGGEDIYVVPCMDL